ncbi:hypothetical protein N7522_013598 [Penicillium canescens]|nr:hypothetical protein N7522_013598 [Penicillium canescens]
MIFLSILATGFFGFAVQAAVHSNGTAEAKLAKIRELLTPQLSANATIVFPDSEKWYDVTHRAAAPRVNPGYLAVVDVAAEDDVVNTIKVANEIGVPFLAVTGTHGWTDDISKIQGGIQIRMRGLNHVGLGPNNDTAYAGGGVIQYEVVQALYPYGKQAGNLPCPFIVSPSWVLSLVGVHSVLQGDHGFAADNLVSAKVALHDGTVVTASATENEDLFWGLRGAGHNLGIVLEFEVKAYDIQPDPWTFMTLVYEADKIEEYFEAWNELEDTIADPGLVVLNGYYRNLPEINAEKPVLVMDLVYQGYDTAAPQYIEAYRAIGPIHEETITDIYWNKLFDITNFGRDDRVCVPSQNWAGYVNSIVRWDPPAMRESYNIFADLVAIETYNTSTFIFESYGRKGVRDFPDDLNAVAPEERNKHNMLAAFLFWSGNNETDLTVARDFGERLQVASRNGEIAHSYVNYAIGGEELPQVYGRDVDRIEKLQAIKAKFDPYNKFGFYASLAA